MEIKYLIKKSKKTKRISLKINGEGEVFVTVPFSNSRNDSFYQKQAEKLVQENIGWIERNLRRLEKSAPKKFNFTTFEKIPYLGEEILLHTVEKAITFPKAIIAGDSNNENRILLVKTPIGSKDNKEMIRDAIIKKFKSDFREIAEEGVEEYNKYYNFKYNRIAIKDNKTNWGSCSSQNNLNFNWKLIFAPMEIIDYVIVHEICHLKEHNHSDRFWNLVAEQFPDYKAKRRWLKRNGNMLRI